MARGSTGDAMQTACATALALMLAGCGTALSEPAKQVLNEASDGPANRATSILNAGVMTEHETAQGKQAKFLFDPLYDDHFGSLAELTPDLIEQIIKGAPPYDDIDAVFVSHAHGDHFSVSQLTRMLSEQEELILVLPSQGLEQLQESEAWQKEFETRVRSVSLENGEASAPVTVAGASIDAFRSPHAGWPERHANVHNITFRVSVPGRAGSVSRVMHLGDADPAAEHYAALQDLLQAKRTGLAIAPFWFTRAQDTAQLIDKTLNAQSMVAVHVPVKVPEDLKSGDWTYFSKAGEVLAIPATP